jgi:hypothetical protein
MSWLTDIFSIIQTSVHIHDEGCDRLGPADVLDVRSTRSWAQGMGDRAATLILATNDLSKSLYRVPHSGCVCIHIGVDLSCSEPFVRLLAWANRHTRRELIGVDSR